MTNEPGLPRLPGPELAGGWMHDTDAGGGEEPPVLDQVFDTDSLYGLRAAVAAHAMAAGLAEGRTGDLVLVVHELAANAVAHGAGRGRLRIWDSGGALRCQVSDDGPAGSRDPARPDGPADWDINFGHGLWLVRQISDQLRLRTGPGGTVVTVIFALPSPGQLVFQVSQRVLDGYPVLAVTGQLDARSAGQFSGAVLSLAATAQVPCLILDLSDLTWWDSAGLAALITAHQQVAARPRGQMVLAGAAGPLIERLREASPDDQFIVAATPVQASRTLGPAASRRPKPGTDRLAAHIDVGAARQPDG